MLGEAEHSLVTCSKNPQHYYNHHLHSCPWCERTVRLGGRDPFPSPQAVAAREHLQIHSKQLKRRTAPTTQLQPPSYVRQVNHWLPVAPQKGSSYQLPRKKSKFLFVVICLLGFGLLGYLDILIKFTSPVVFQNAYSQQRLIPHNQDNTASKTFADYLKQGDASYKIRDYEQAVEKFTQAIEQNPTYAKAYINRGNSHYNLKEYEAAISDYNHALQINPEEVKAFVNRGNVRSILAEYSTDPDREYNQAIGDFNNALRLNPKEAEAYIRRGIVRSQLAKYSGDSQQDYKKAINDFNQALNFDSSKAEAYFQRGLIRYHIAQYSSQFEKDYKEAIEDFDQALHIDSQLAKVYLKRGIVRYELAQYGGSESKQNHTKAVEDLQTAAKISLENEDMDNYQQSLSNICVVLENKCDSFFQKANLTSH